MTTSKRDQALLPVKITKNNVKIGGVAEPSKNHLIKAMRFNSNRDGHFLTVIDNFKPG